MPEALNQAQFIARRFGGTPKFARAIGEPVHKVRDWCRRTGFVPEYARRKTLEAAQREGANVTALDFIRHLLDSAD